MSDDTTLNAVELATELTIAWLGNQNNRVTAEDVPAFLRTMHATINELSGASSGSTDRLHNLLTNRSMCLPSPCVNRSAHKNTSSR